MSTTQPKLIPELLPRPTPEESTEGQAAMREAAAFGDGVDLSSRQQLKKYNQISRSDSLAKHIHQITIGLIYLIAGLIALMVVIYVLQIITPERYRFLSEEDQEKLQHFLFSGIIGGLVTSACKKIGFNSEDEE